MRVSPAGKDAGGTRHGRRLGARSEHQPTRPATTLSVGLKSAAALSRTQKHRTARTRRGGLATRMTSPVRAKPFVTPMRRGQLPPSSCRHQQVDGHHRPSGRTASPSGITPSTIMSPTRNHPGSWTEIRLGARAHHTTPRPDRAHSPPKNQAVQPSNPEPHLTTEACTDKEPSSEYWQHSAKPGLRVRPQASAWQRAAALLVVHQQPWREKALRESVRLIPSGGSGSGL